MPNRVVNPPAGNRKNLQLEKFQKGPKHHDKDLYELNRPRKSVILEDDVIEHLCPDFVVPAQRVETVDASMAA